MLQLKLLSIAWRRSLAFTITLMLGLVANATSQSLFAQQAWEFSPYRVQLVVATSSEIADHHLLNVEIRRTLMSRGEMLFRATWNAEAIAAPAGAAAQLATMQESIPYERLLELFPELERLDKLMLIHVGPSSGNRALIDLTVREFDLRSRLFSGYAQRTAIERNVCAMATVDLVAQAFTPLMRIERVDGANLTGRSRAGGLVISDDQPAAITDRSVLRPVVRRNDRKGEPSGIQAVPWSLIRIASRDQANLSGELVSGFRYAIPVKGGQRTERLALVVKPREAATKLRLQSRGQNPRPLVGYGVYLRGETGETATLVGVSDWQGAVQLPASTGIQVLLVKSGQQLLARLPLVPGQEDELVATLPDDTPRLEAEGVVVSFHSRIMDLVAQRELAASRFRKKLKEKEFDEAQVLLDRFRELDSGEDLRRALDQQAQRIRSTDKMTQSRIEKLFTTARQLIPQFVKNETASTMAQELARRKAGGADPEEAKPVAAPAVEQPVTPVAPAPTTPGPATPATTVPPPAAAQPAVPATGPPGPPGPPPPPP